MAILNEDNLTQADSRNELAKTHDAHRTHKLGSSSSRATPFPGIRVEVSKYLCYDCNKTFTAFNFIRNEEVVARVPPTLHLD